MLWTNAGPLIESRRKQSVPVLGSFRVSDCMRAYPSQCKKHFKVIHSGWGLVQAKAQFKIRLPLVKTKQWTPRQTVACFIWKYKDCLSCVQMISWQKMCFYNHMGDFKPYILPDHICFICNITHDMFKLRMPEVNSWYWCSLKVLKDKAGDIIYFSYCQQIPLYKTNTEYIH